MERSEIRARLTWKPGSKASRFAKGDRYTTVARFEDEKQKYPAEAWSLVVDFDSPQHEEDTTIAFIRFLVDDAPTYLLYPRSRFELYEGAKLIASAEVI